MTRIAVVGGGAMGSIYASLLHERSPDVCVVDIWREHVEAIQTSGLRVDGPGDTSRTVRLHATTGVDSIGPVDLAIVAVKAFHTGDAAAALRGRLRPGAIVLTMQNGLGNAERLAAELPDARIALGVTGHAGGLLGAGHVVHRVSAPTHVGWLAGGPADDLADVLTSTGLVAVPTDDVQSLAWQHVAIVCGVNAIAALCRVPNIEVARQPEAARLSELTIREVVAVACAAGVRLPWPDPVAACQRVYLDNGEDHLSSMTVDVLRERPTEIDALNGAVVEYGRRLGVPTPVNEMLWCAIKTVERTPTRRAVHG